MEVDECRPAKNDVEMVDGPAKIGHAVGVNAVVGPVEGASDAPFRMGPGQMEPLVGEVRGRQEIVVVALILPYPALCLYHRISSQNR